MKKRLTFSVRSFVLTVMIGFCSLVGMAQTTIINPGLEGGFELGPLFSDNGWTVVNTAVVNGSKWYTTAGMLTNGTYSFMPTDAGAAYVSSDNGTSWSYQTPAVAAGTSHFYRDVTFPAGQTAASLSFRYNVLGENTWDEILVYLCPTTLTPAVNSPSGSSVVPTWTGTGSAVLLGRYSLLAAGSGTTINVPLDPTVIGNCASSATWRLVFTWKNDGGGGTNPPAAIDDIALFSAASTINLTGGTYTINNTLPTGGSNFQTFTEAIIALNSANACGPLTGPIVFNVSAGQTFIENPPAITATGNGVNTITFQKSGAGANPIVSATGTTGTADAGLIISGGDLITFDGVDINGTVAVEYGYLVRNSSATNGAQNNTIKNCSVSLNRGNTTSTSAAIFQSASTTAGGFTPTAATGANSQNKYYNLTISNAIVGIYLLGNTTFRDLNCEIGTTTCAQRNTITNVGPTVSTFVSGRGIWTAAQENLKVYNNTISNVAANQATGWGVFSTTNYGNGEFYNNAVSNISVTGSTTTTSVAYGMQIQNAATGTVNAKIYNNSISNIFTSFTSTATTTRRAIGLHVGLAGATATQSYDIDNNSISIGSGLNPTYSNTCFEIQNATAVYRVRNNVFANFTGAQTTSRHTTWTTTSPTTYGAAGSISNYNDLFVANDLGVSGFTASNGVTTYFNSIANWTAAMTGIVGTDANSIAVNPSYLDNNTNLHATAIALNNAGTTLQPYVTADQDCAARTDLDLGAYNLIACSGTPTAGSINGSSTVCSGLSTTLNLTGASTQAGTTYQWASSLTPGGPYGTLMGTSTAQNTGAVTAPTYYTVTATCSVSGLSATTSEFALTVNALPTVAVSPTTGLICLPGGASIPLTATGTATTYSWAPVTGLSATTGTSTIANPTATTTYTVSGTDGNGCIGTASSVITVANNPALISVTGNPTSVCSGSNSQLQANVYGASPVNNYSYATGTGATLNPMVGATQVINASNDDTPTAAPLNIGFTFNYNGTNYTQYSVSPDGWLLLGGATATSDFSNQVTDPTNQPKLYPYWDDMATGTTGNVQTLVTGTAPNRIFIAQWFVTIPRNTTGPANSTFQAWLYEATGVVEFRYGTMGAAAMSSSVGLTGGNTNYNCVTITGATASTVATNDANAGQPTTGTSYTFTPPTVPVVWSPATYLNSTTITNPLATAVTSTTTYTVVATAPSTCTSTGTVTLTAGALLSSSASLSPTTPICAGQNVTLQATPIDGGAPYTYAWSGPNGFTSTSQNPVLTAVTSLEEGIYTVVINDNCGSTSTSTVTLSVNPIPTVAVTPTSGLFCSPGTAVTMTASGASTYSWSPATGLSATTGTSVDASPSANTTYTVTGTTLFGCTSTATAAIANSASVSMGTVSATPSVICNGDNSALVGSAVINASTTYCQGTYTTGTSFGDYISSVQLNTLNNVTGASASPYYTLYPQTGTTTTTLTAGSTYTLTLVAGTYTSNDLAAWIDYNQSGSFEAIEKLGETDNLGASPTSTSFTFTVPLTANNGSVRFRVREMDHSGTNDMDPCAVQSAYGETEDYVITITGGVDPLSYAWTPATFLSSTNTASTTATAMTSTTAYTLTATSAGGCTATGSATVTVNQPTTSTINPVNCITYTSPDGSVYTTSGTYINVIPNAAGCDSTITINLTINQPTASTINPIACDSYVSPDGSNYTTSGTYVNVIPNSVGCDSTITINLTVNYSTTSTINPVVCDSYTSPDGSVYTSSGTYVNVIPNAAGCDSTITINLSVYGSSSSTINPVVCDTYSSPDGSVYTTSGTYINVIPNYIGCDSVITINLTVNYTPVVSAGNDLTVCQNGQAILSGSGAATYTWNNGVTNNVSFIVLGTNTYTVTGTSAAGCTATDVVTITAIPLPIVDAGANIEQCGDQSVTLSGSGAFVYTWNNSVVNGVAFNSPIGTTSYIVTGVDTYGCSNTDVVNVTINAIPVATATAIDQLTIEATPANAFYQWIDCATNSPIFAATGSTYTASVNGSYAVIVTGAGGCADTSDCVIIDNVGLGSLDDKNAIALYPNPTNGDVYLTLGSIEKVNVVIYDAQGKMIQSLNELKNGSIINLNNVEPGVYMFYLNSENGTHIERIVKN